MPLPSEVVDQPDRNRLGVVAAEGRTVAVLVARDDAVAAHAECVVREVAVAQIGVDHDLGANVAIDVGVAGDRLQLERLLSNLVKNALRYTTRPGVVDVCASVRDGRPVLSVVGNEPGAQRPRWERTRGAGGVCGDALRVATFDARRVFRASA